MSRDKRARAKGRKTGGRFAMLPRSVLMCPAVTTLHNLAHRVLTIGAAEMDGGNNGDINLVRDTLAKYGLQRSGAVQKAIDELVERGLFIKTRQGGLGCCSLYAVAWYELTRNEKSLPKLDRPLPTLPDMRFLSWKIASPGALTVPCWRPDGSFDGEPDPTQTPQRNQDSSFQQIPRNREGAPSDICQGARGLKGAHRRVSNG